MPWWTCSDRPPSRGGPRRAGPRGGAHRGAFVGPAAVEHEPAAFFRIDASNPADVRFYVSLDGSTFTRVNSSTTYDMSDAAAGTLVMPMVHVEKSSDDTTADVRVDCVDIMKAPDNIAA